MTSGDPRPARSRSAGGPVLFATRRRLGVAFACVLASLLLTASFQAFALRRIAATVENMEEHDEQMQLALQLDAAIHEQYGREGQFVMGKGARLREYEAARGRSLQLIERLRALVDEPEAIAALDAARDAIVELDRAFSEEVAPAVQNEDPAAALVHDRSYPLVSRIRRSIGQLVTRLQATVAASRASLDALETTSARLLAAALAVTAALVAAAVYYLSRSVARPLARLSRGAAALGSGDLDARIAIDTPDEFGALAAELNAMAVALKEHQARLVESEKLAGIGRVAAGFAHEINNPLQVILGYLSLNRDVADPRLKDQLAAVGEETLRCKQIVESILGLARPEEAMALRPVDLRLLCDDVSERLRPSAQAAGVSLAVVGGARALADRPKLRQAIFNLVKNAVEAAGPQGSVAVRIGESEAGSHVAVADTGPGIPAALRPRLFEPFFTTKAAGTGLGLAVSRTIARAHGGDIEVRNGDLGGALFTLHLPGPTRGAVVHE
ncbi:MAG TPA: ATP-binding protein [Anaeromyxobacter sp.]|nr:ATP-binding protein [Anaeromyxobacter sp.]